MKTAIQVQTAKERAAIAVRIIKTGNGLHEREFDDCFEMGDGDQVFDLLVEWAREDYILAKAITIRIPDLGSEEGNIRLRAAIHESLNNPIMKLFDE